ncbi:MAG TPA: basic secretory protein-like protein [Verrucomicrobiae bacterium]
MKKPLLLIVAGSCLVLTGSVWAGTKVTIDFNDNDEASPAFDFKTVPRPVANDVAANANFRIVAGRVDSTSGDLSKLHDGQLPQLPDQPKENFFFESGSNGGRLEVDLGHRVNIRQINTYSWHPSTRGPQVYKLYAATGAATNFSDAPKPDLSPEQCGWSFVATVNTCGNGRESGGQYGVSLANPDGDLGQYRYLLFDIAATEKDDSYGNTFFSEIDVVDADSPQVPDALYTFKTGDGACAITLDARQAPALENWATNQLAPVLAAWYPKITALLQSPGYSAPTQFRITLRPMDGVAYTAGRHVVANSTWLAGELQDEALGSLVHELVHVVQQYHSRRNPGWLVEGSADYIRWFLYDRDRHGADLVWMRHRGPKFSPHYNDSYRVTANFLDWVTQKYDREIVTQMGVAMREDKYDESLWQKYTGKSLAALGEEWKRSLMAQLADQSSANKGE